MSARYLGIIQEENKRLADQVEKVLQIARMEKGDFQLNIKTVDVHEIIEAAVKNIAIQIETREGRITTDLQATETVIQADKVHLANMVSNLLDNANKYSPETPQISVRTFNGQGGIMIEISDKGKGISKEMLDKVFDKFFRVPTGDLHDVKGFGLGLSYVKNMVEAHQGQVTAKSELGKGSTFQIFLPYQHEA
jgi:two-component system phosphate regulon sensor histidine kinase PhoR